jgi:hypothetical protein
MKNDPVVGKGPVIGLQVSCSAQKSPDLWWRDDYPIPPELLGDLVELLKGLSEDEAAVAKLMTPEV